MTAINKTIQNNKTYKYDVESIPDVTTDDWYIKGVSSTNNNFSFVIGDDKKSFSYSCSGIDNGTVLSNIEFDLTIGFNNSTGPKRTDKIVKTYWNITVNSPKIPFVVSAYIYTYNGMNMDDGQISITIKGNYKVKYYISNEDPDLNNLPNETLYTDLTSDKTFTLYPYDEGLGTKKFLYLLGDNAGTYTNNSEYIKFNTLNDSYMIFITGFADVLGLIKNQKLMNSYSLRNLFGGCRLDNFPILSSMTVPPYGYRDMFNGAKLPNIFNINLPATTLGEGCYYGMFENSTNINDHIYYFEKFTLPATSLANDCYYGMFKGCTWLKNVSENLLPATTLATDCYYGMFNGCSGLTNAPELPATTLATDCYRSMFNGCSSLTTAPELPATTLATDCYYGMFRGCSSLTTAPELPATTLATDCYYGMFNGCSSLTTAPELPATKLAEYCYREMFNSCTSLTTAPDLPATELAKYCYYGMFNGCSSLTTAPELPATSCEDYCYNYMFYGCTKLNYIKAMFLTTPSNFYTGSWVNRVASSGTFVKNAAATWSVTGGNGIPEGWTVVTATE